MSKADRVMMYSVWLKGFALILLVTLSVVTSSGVAKSNWLTARLVSGQDVSELASGLRIENFSACQALSALRIAILHGDVISAIGWIGSAAGCSRSLVRDYSLGQAYFQHGDIDQALAEWSKDQDVAIYQLEYFLKNEENQLAMRLIANIRNNYPDLSSNPIHQRTFFQATGQLAMQQKDYETALWAYEQGFAVDPTRIDYQVFAAIAEREMGRLAQAKHRLEEALLSIPSSKPQARSWTYEQLGLTQELLGNSCEAQAAFRQALSLVENISGYSIERLNWFISKINALHCDQKSP